MANEKLPDELLSSSYLYRGVIVNVRQDMVRTAGGKEGFREVIEHPGAVAVLAVDDQDRVLMVRQYRQAVGEFMLEIPAGKIEPGEEPLNCAKRELIEETGRDADQLKELYCFYPSPGFCDEKIFIFKASGLRPAKVASSDPDEEITTLAVSLQETKKMIEEGTISDGKSIIALQYALMNI